MTPYETHAELSHHLSRYSPNGVDIIEECDDCPMRWLLSPGAVPLTLQPLTQEQRQGPNRSMALDGLDRVRCQIQAPKSPGEERRRLAAQRKARRANARKIQTSPTGGESRSS